MSEPALNIIDNNSILLSRNRPVAFVVGAASFLGSHLVDKLLKKNIQVVGVDEIDEGNKKNLTESIKNKDFHLINQPDNSFFPLDLHKLDYSFFIPDLSNESQLNKKLEHYLRFLLKLQEREVINKKIEHDTPAHLNIKIAFISSIGLYQKEITKEYYDLREAELRFARFVKDYKLNGRIIRFAPMYGPRMHFLEKDPMIGLIQAALLEDLEGEPTFQEFGTRSLYIDDAVDLLIKTVFLGSTSQKIYDGINPSPIKPSEIKQVLLDPLWYEQNNFHPTQLPTWPTPNLNRTTKELSWYPKAKLVSSLRDTIAYFKENDVKVPLRKPDESNKDRRKLFTEDSLIQSTFLEKNESKVETSREEPKKQKVKSQLNKENFKKDLWTLFGILLIVLGFIYPVLSLGIGSFNIRANLSLSKVELSKGNFKAALKNTEEAKSTIVAMRQLVESLTILKKISLLNSKINNLEKVLDITEEGIDGVNHAALGMHSLYKTTRIMSGEEVGEIKPLYQNAQLELSTASKKISLVQSNITDQKLISDSPRFISTRLQDLGIKLKAYGELVDKARTAAYLLPEVTGIDSKRAYLVLLQNNMELRPTGGFIGSYARIEFEGGKIKKISVDDIYNLDGNLKEHIEPPLEIKSDLGQINWYLRDSNFEPDFPTSARQAQFFYNKEAGERVNGVFAMDLTASGKLIKAVGGLNLVDYGEVINENNLFEKVISHAEVNFFPGSFAKKNYLTSLQTELFNKIFFISNQDWSAIVNALGESLGQKHLMVYLADPQIFSYLASQNWTGTLPRQPSPIGGETDDFIAPVEANLGANKSNYFLERKYRLETKITKEEEVIHHLVISYKNNSPSDTFPAGIYKNRFRIYLPAGTKLVKAVLGEKDITAQISSFSDYGRAGFSTLIEIAPKEQKALILDYKLASQLSFKNNLNRYKLDVIKQAGTDQDNFDWVLTYPINMQIIGSTSSTESSQELSISTDLITDRTFLVNFKKKI